LLLPRVCARPAAMGQGHMAPEAGTVARRYGTAVHERPVVPGTGLRDDGGRVHSPIVSVGDHLLVQPSITELHWVLARS
jgi:hypothetical protein